MHIKHQNHYSQWLRYDFETLTHLNKKQISITVSDIATVSSNIDLKWSWHAKLGPEDTYFVIWIRLPQWSVSFNPSHAHINSTYKKCILQKSTQLQKLLNNNVQ